MMHRVLGLLIVSLSLGGCAWQQHEVELSMTSPTITSNTGDGVTVGVRVYDDRESETVGQRAAGMVGADITVRNLMMVIDRAVREALESHGFRVVETNDTADASITVALRSFRFFVETGFWTGANNVEIALKADARKEGRDYLNTYRFDSEKRVVFVSDGATIDAALSTGLDDVITQFAADRSLMEFLGSDS